MKGMSLFLEIRKPVAEKLDMTHLFLDDCIYFIFPERVRNEILHPQIKDNGVFLCRDGRLQNSLKSGSVYLFFKKHAAISKRTEIKTGFTIRIKGGRSFLLFRKERTSSR